MTPTDPPSQPPQPSKPTPPNPQSLFTEKPSIQRPLQPQPRNDYQVPTILLSGILCGILLFVGLAFFWSPPDLTFSLPGFQTPFTIKTPKPVTLGSDMILLVMGVDKNQNSDQMPFSGTRTDTLMMVRVNPESHTVSAVSVPRDSKVYIGEGSRVDKINAAFAYGGADLTVKTVEHTFGIPVDGYIVINSNGIRELVDALGGVTVDIEKPLKYRDRTAGLNIDLQPGKQRLDGIAAEGFLRFRHDALGDIGRVRRQQHFLSALVKELRNPINISRIPQLVGFSQKFIQTDLTYRQLLGLAWFGKDLDLRKVRVATLPGHPTMEGASYWVIDPDTAQKVLDRLILDNLSMVGLFETSGAQLKVGLLVPRGTSDTQIDEWKNAIERQNFKVSCQSTRSGQPNQLIEHTNRVNDNATSRLQQALPQWKLPRLVYAPIGSTFEQNTCNTNEDYTVVIGSNETR